MAEPVEGVAVTVIEYLTSSTRTVIEDLECADFADPRSRIGIWKPNSELRGCRKYAGFRRLLYSARMRLTREPTLPIDAISPVLR